ncbi:MAG: hypothetical protein K8953_01495, partial [Proteobacteria bacterium]|nr:hypothetical protein [Pseudomonadota bacterium]
MNTEAGAAFVPHAEAAQDAYCESGVARTTSTVVTTADRVNCTNIGSSPVFADLARNITQNGITTYNSAGDTVTANGVTPQNPNIGGFLRAGVFGSKLGVHTGRSSVFRQSPLSPIPATYDQNTGNFDRGNNEGGAWTGLPGGVGGSPSTIWDVASKTDPKDGFTYFLARDGDGFDLSFAGIWQTTNLGAPLAAPVGSAPTSAIWEGTFTAYAAGGAPNLVLTVLNEAEVQNIHRKNINEVTTPFYVDFANGTFNVHNPAGTDSQNPNGTNPTTGVVRGYTFAGGTGSQAIIAKRITFDVDGVFGAGVPDPNNNARTLNAGELGGTVTR